MESLPELEPVIPPVTDPDAGRPKIVMKVFVLFCFFFFFFCFSSNTKKSGKMPCWSVWMPFWRTLCSDGTKFALDRAL